MLKESWKTWRQDQREEIELEEPEIAEEHEGREDEEAEEEDWIEELRSHRESRRGVALCFLCVMDPCTCILKKAEDRMKEMRGMGRTEGEEQEEEQEQRTGKFSKFGS